MKQQVQVVVLLVVCGVYLTAAKPQGAITNEVLGPEVGASFGGYQASAGLQGGPHAQASIPGGSGASAATSFSSSSSSNNNDPNRKPTQFDNIFNIPISVLQAVNQLLQGGGKAKANAGAGAAAQVPAHGAVSGSSASSSASADSGPVRRQSNFFDDIFNIPISALTSVNHLLNNKEKLRVEGRSAQNASDTSYPIVADRRQLRREERARRRQLHHQRQHPEYIDGADHHPTK